MTITRQQESANVLGLCIGCEWKMLFGFAIIRVWLLNMRTLSFGLGLIGFERDLRFGICWTHFHVSLK